MRILVFASLLGGALPVQAQTVPSSDYQVASVANGQSRIVLTSHTVVKGDTVEDILIGRGIHPSPRAVGLVLEANPNVRGADRIPAGTVLWTPRIEGGAGSGPAKIISPSVVRDTTLTADALDRNASRSAQAESIQKYSDALRESVAPVYGLGAKAMGQWNGHSRAILDLTMSSDVQDQRAAELLAGESFEDLALVRSMAIKGNPTALLVTLKGRNPPAADYPPTCRIRYAYIGYAYKGHVVPTSNVQDPIESDCKDGRAQLEALISYGIWTEWLEGNHWRRSEIKRVKLMPDTTVTIDLPMQPFE